MRKEKAFYIRSQDELELLLEYWMCKLGLNNWEICVKFVRSCSMPDELGNVTYVLSSKQAVIKILRYEDYKEANYDFEWDMEETLVHEILHLQFAKLSCNNEEDGAEYREMHSIIEDTARQLVNLKRGE